MRAKTSLTVSAAALVALTLAGCGGPSSTASPGASDSAAGATPGATATAQTSTTPTPTPTPTTRPAIKAANSIDPITVTDEQKTVTPAPVPGATAAPTPTQVKQPKINFKAPFAIDATRSKVLKPGTGATLAANSIVTLHYHGVNGYTGEVFDSSFERGEPAQFSLDQVVPGFKTGLTGKKVGDRVLIAMPGKDAYDSAGGNPPKILVGDTLFFVVDIIDIDYQTPHGTAVNVPANLPKYAADASGKPTLTLDTKAQPPASTVVQPIITGSSPQKVKATDMIAAHYRSWSWKTGKQLEDVYDKVDTGAMAELLPCWRDGLVNQPLGSRIMLVCPPSSGYAQGSTASPSVASGDTVVYVVDLMMAADAQQAQQR